MKSTRFQTINNQKQTIMKKTLLVAAAMILALAACKKEEPVQTAREEEQYDVEVSLLGADMSIMTKASDVTPTASESAYKTACILVYDKVTGNLESYKDWSGSSVSFTLNKGTKLFYGVVNAGSDIASRAGTVTALLSNTATLKSDLGGFFMIGCQEVEVAGKSSFTITVKRAAAKFVYKDVKLAFDSPALAAQSFTIMGVLVINAPGDISYNAVQNGLNTYAPTVWYNQRKYASSDCNSYLYVGGINKTAANGSTSSISKVLYSYPNYTSTDSHAATWSARKTRVCLECKIGSETVYYPVTLATVEPNHVYTINSLTVTKKGISDPDGEWDDAGATGSITIADWTDGGSYDETL